MSLPLQVAGATGETDFKLQYTGKAPLFRVKIVLSSLWSNSSYGERGRSDCGK